MLAAAWSLRRPPSPARLEWGALRFVVLVAVLGSLAQVAESQQCLCVWVSYSQIKVSMEVSSFGFRASALPFGPDLVVRSLSAFSLATTVVVLPPTSAGVTLDGQDSLAPHVCFSCVLSLPHEQSLAPLDTVEPMESVAVPTRALVMLVGLGRHARPVCALIFPFG
jgi:hypothetical protein